MTGPTASPSAPWYSSHRLSFRVVVTGVVAMVLISLLMMMTARQFIAEISDGYERETANVLLNRMEATVTELSEKAHIGALMVAALPQVQQALAARDRDTLQTMFLPQWPQLQQQGIGQFQFHLPDASSFLRVHKPEKYGDDLSSFRQSVVQVNNTHVPVVGVEKGVAGLGVRAVVPVSYQDRPVGSVEFGVALSRLSFASLLEDQRIDLAVYLHDGGRWTTAMAPAYAARPLADAAYQQALQGRYETETRIDGHPHHVILTPLQDYSGTTIGVMEVSYDRGNIAALMSSIDQRMLLVALLTIIAAAVVFIWLVKRSMSPLKRLVAAMEALTSGSGSVSQKLRVQGVTEVEQVTAAFNGFTSGLGTKVSELIRSVSDMTTQVALMAEESGRAHQGMRRQQDEIDQIATAMTEMVSTVHSVAENTSQAADSAQHADEQSGQGVALVEENIRDISSLSETVSNTSEVVQGVVQATEQIGQILSVIRTIAEQTNLLALNAAIEAARAGEHGRGFAVVADEVRTLAQRTRSSTDEIEGMISELESSVGQTVTQMERSLEQAGRSVSQSQETGASLQRIKQAVDRITDMNTQIATASEEQSSVSEEINRNILNIRDISNGTALVAEHSADIAAQLARDTEVLMSVLKGFNSRSDELILAQARSAHLAWKARLRAYLNSDHGENIMSRDEATNHHNCKLGQWYYGEAGRHLMALPVMQQLEGPHQRLHETIGELMTAKERGDMASAEALLEQVEQLSHQVAAVLEELQGAVAEPH